MDRKEYNPRVSVPCEVVNEVVGLVAEVEEMDMQSVFIRTRKMEVVKVRNMSAYILNRLGYSLHAIGKVFGLDHSTICHSIRAVRDGMDVYIGLRERIESLISKVKSKEE